MHPTEIRNDVYNIITTTAEKKKEKEKNRKQEYTCMR